MKIDADWLLAPPLVAVFDLLDRAGHRALVVGGAVRNSVMGLPVSDMDLATDARPDTVTNLAKSGGFKVIPTGLDHGTVTVISGGQPFEITTFRRDEESDGRRARVAFTDDLDEDARRRDFTMNALYVGADGIVLDPVGGLDDARARRVRFIEDASVRIREDYLRILRFFRFNALYGRDGFEADALAAIADNLEGLQGLARERIGMEMRKMLVAADPSMAVCAMAQVGVLARVLPGADPAALPVLVHFESLHEIAPAAMRRLAVLGGADVVTHLRLSRSEDKQLRQLRDGIGSMSTPGELGYRHGLEMGRDILALRAALGLDMPGDWQALLAQGANAVFPIKASDLMPAVQGAALGQKLAMLETKWIASGFALSREDLL